jgi:hypothetical protein
MLMVSDQIHSRAVERDETTLKTIGESGVPKYVSEILVEGPDSSLALAVNMKSPDAIGYLLGLRQSSQEMLTRAIQFCCDLRPDSVSRVPISGAVFARIGELLAFPRFGELLSKVTAVALFPVLLAKMEPHGEIVQEMRRRKGVECREFAHCVLLRHSAYCEHNEFVFSLFNA